MTARAIRYQKADPVQRFAILDLTKAQLRLLIEAGEFYLEDTGDGTDPSIDHEAVAELTAILQQAREALGQ